MSDKIFVLGNTYDANNIWFRQLTIAREIRGLKPNDQKVMNTLDGMPIFVYYLTPRSPEKRRLFNKAHYGFGNPQLNAITGAGAWNSKIYPVVTQLPNRKSVFRGLYFKIYDDLYLECEYLVCDLGNYFFIHPARISSAQMSQLVYTNTFIEYQNELLFGYDKISHSVITAIRENRIVFSDNETGNLFEKFINERK